MPKNLSPGVAMLTMTLLLMAGCADSRDERYRQLAQQALHEQSEQNKRLAEQSKQIAEASRRLVEGDAAARKDLLATQKQLTSELHSKRAGIDRQREELEQERRNIAAQRHRNPVIAQAIGAVGLTLACLLPLLLAAYVIRAVNRDGDDASRCVTAFKKTRIERATVGVSPNQMSGIPTRRDTSIPSASTDSCSAYRGACFQLVLESSIPSVFSEYCCGSSHGVDARNSR